MYFNQSNFTIFNKCTYYYIDSRYICTMYMVQRNLIFSNIKLIFSSIIYQFNKWSYNNC